jgi:hypothetical protein
VHSCFPGFIVAARLADDRNMVGGMYGSRNFILMKHEIKKRVFYSLYMHLDAVPLSTDNTFIRKLMWLGKRTLHYKFKSKRVYRNSPKEDKETYEGTFAVGDVVEWVEDAQPAPWKKIRLNDGREMYMSYRSDVIDEVITYTPDEELLNKFKTNKVVKLDIQVPGDQLLWRASDGVPAFQTPGFLHWEIFSEQNVFPPPDQIDKDQDTAPSASAGNSEGIINNAIRAFKISTVEGPAKAYPGNNVTYRANTNLGDPTTKEKEQINWIVKVDGVETLKIEKHGDVLFLEVKEDWKEKKITVFPYRNSPSSKCSIETTVSKRKPIVWRAIEDTDDKN